MSLQDKLDALKAKFETEMAPPEMVAVMHRVTDELLASGQVKRALKAGDRAPTFTLPDAEGRPVSSQDLLTKGPLVVTFYRARGVPTAISTFRRSRRPRPEIETHGASLDAISPQTAANSRKSQRSNKLAFPILSDKGGDLAARFGIRWRLPEDLQAIHKQLGADLAAFNGDDSWTLPMPARYVIGQDGLIAYGEINPAYTRRPEPNDLLPILRKQASSA